MHRTLVQIRLGESFLLSLLAPLCLPNFPINFILCSFLEILLGFLLMAYNQQYQPYPGISSQNSYQSHGQYPPPGQAHYQQNQHNQQPFSAQQSQYNQQQSFGQSLPYNPTNSAPLNPARPPLGAPQYPSAGQPNGSAIPPQIPYSTRPSAAYVCLEGCRQGEIARS